MVSDTVALAAPSASLQFTDLPQEIQKEIISHCHQPELICLSLVSKHFRALAAAELYRNFHIVFPDEDDPAFDSPIDGLAGGLETFVTSDYDYAKHLRDISLDTLSAGDKAETAYKPYLYSVSCGKFLNTLLLMTLRKAKALETLRWNIRVELSRPVYTALHKIDTLSHLHIRLQAGPSLYEHPPPLPLSSPGATPNASSHHLPLFDAQPPPPTFATLPPPPPPFYIGPSTSSLPPLPPLLAPPKPPARIKALKKSSTSKNPPTLSGFKNLKTLSVLDIDDLDVVTELKTCVRNSHATLSKLKLSFSHNMAMRARKPPPDIDPDDSDPDDEFQVVPVAAPPPITPYDDISGPARAFRAQEERKTQESVLGRIFDVEPYVVKKQAKKPRDKENEPPSEDTPTDPGRCFLESLKAVSEKLMKDLAGSDDIAATQQEILDTIETAARTYIAESEGKAAARNENGVNGESSASGAEMNGTAEPDASKTEDAQQGESSLFESKTSKGKELEQDANPDDINIEEPVEDSFVEEPSEIATPEPVNGAEAVSNKESTSNGNGILKATANGDTPLAPDSNNSNTTANLSAQKQNFKTLAEKLESFEVEAGKLRKEIQELPTAPGLESENRLKDADLRMTELSTNIKDIQSEMATVAAEIEDAEKQDTATAQRDGADGVPSRITEYARSTRGLSLQTLSIYLIPVKASVLSKAVDLRVLRRITLLNVGNQAPIWALLAKENKQQPIALRKIFTDNVSVPFLTFVSQLEELNELFMLERPDKYKPEPFAPKTAITMDQIRRMVLKRHMSTMKRLMIKNQQDSTWDVDDKTMLLICRRGKKLEELAVSMGIRAIHTTLQHISGLVNLRALHIINLRNDDTCVWVMRETKRFVIDTLSHYPELKLEWLAIDDDERVERILRLKEIPKEIMKGKSAKSKGKQKASFPPLTTLPNGDHFPVLTLDNLDLGSESDEDDEDGVTTLDGRSKLETIDNIHFYDVWGVRIFKREVVTGRL